MSKPNPFSRTPEQIAIDDEIKRQYPSCASLDPLAASVGLTVTQVRNRAAKLGLKRKRTGKKTAGLIYRIKKAHDLKRDGYAVGFIAEVLGVTVQSIYNYLRVKK